MPEIMEQETSTVQAVPADKLPADVIRQQLGYAPRVVPKRKDVRVERKVTQSTAALLETKNFKYIDQFDTFWSNVRSINGIRRERLGRKSRTHSAPINGRTAPVGAIHRGAKGSSAAHLLASLSKEK